LEKPKTALEALLYADGIAESVKEKNTVVMVKDKIVSRMKRVARLYN